MPAMVNPMDSFLSFQEAYSAGLVSPMQCFLHPQMRVFMDKPMGPSGPRRFSYTFHEGPTVTALAILASAEPLDGLARFDLGYAVAEPYRNRGLAKQIAIAAIEEMQHGLARHSILEYYVEAIVETANVASQRVAAQAIQKIATPVTDEISGKPAFRYIRRVSKNSAAA